MQLLAALILELSAVDALTARTGAGGVTALDHEILDDAVEDEAIIIALFGQGYEVLDGFGGNLRVKLDGNIAHVGVHDGAGAFALGKLL